MRLSSLRNVLRLMVRGRRPDSVRIENSEFFDRDWYLAEYMDVARSGIDPVYHYIMYGWREGRCPSAMFDSRWYLQQYPDVAEASVEPLAHYLRFGAAEGRIPNPFFDAAWYEGTTKRLPNEVSATPYAIYLARGLAAGDAPLPELQAVFSVRGKDTGNAFDQYKRLVRAIQPWWERYGRDKFAVLVAMFSPFDNHANAGDPVDRLIGFLEHAWTHDVDPGPLFRAEYYRDLLHERGLEPRAGETLLQYYLREGYEHRIVPTPHFDEAAYYRQYPDIQPTLVWGFEHFMRSGVFEGRNPSLLPRVSVAHATATDANQTRISNWKYFLARCGNTVELEGIYESPTRFAQVIDEIFASETFQEIMRRAVDLDPAIGDPLAVSDILIPPLHDARHFALARLRSLLPRLHYDTIVCVPWIRTGGADLVACQLSTAVRHACPGETLLMLRTDQPNFDRPEWIPDDIDVVDASDVFNRLSPIDAQTLLYVVFLGLAPRRVVNVNSRLCWNTIARFGSRLSRSVDLYSYLFCWDQTARGYRVGYPSDFFPDTAQHMRAVFTDTHYLKNELTTIYQPPADLCDRIVPLHSPATSVACGRSMAELSVESARKRPRPRVLWAGRLDRQKRFDLVQAIAIAMPDVDFICWGSAVLDAPPDHSKSPSNLTLRDGFSSYDELPLSNSDLWLFTSEWEGMPTILIELASRGVSIVASAVGGVPELIDDSTGWLVTDVCNVSAYVTTLRAALGSPSERVARALMLRERARERHTMSSYVEHIADVLNMEGKFCCTSLPS